MVKTPFQEREDETEKRILEFLNSKYQNIEWKFHRDKWDFYISGTALGITRASPSYNYVDDLGDDLEKYILNSSEMIAYLIYRKYFWRQKQLDDYINRASQRLSLPIP